jgi:alkylation response protein AidB-like acyl-CoA dehydrogenase
MDVLAAQVIREEFARAKAPGEVRGIGTQMVVPTLLEHGTEAQKTRFIPPHHPRRDFLVPGLFRTLGRQ